MAFSYDWRDGPSCARQSIGPDLRWPFPTGLESVTGARVTGLPPPREIHPDAAGGGDSVLLHLGMSGRIVLSPARPNMPTPHEHLVLETDDGWRMGFVDPRRFGSVDLVATHRRMPTSSSPSWVRTAGSHPSPPARLSASLIGQAHADQGGTAGSEGRSGARQHLRVRGAVPRAPQSAALAPTPSRARARHGWCRRSRRRCRRRSQPADRRCATTCSRTASWAISSTPGRCTAARGNRASAVQAAPPVQGSAG